MRGAAHVADSYCRLYRSSLHLLLWLQCGLFTADNKIILRSAHNDKYTATGVYRHHTAKLVV